MRGGDAVRRACVAGVGRGPAPKSGLTPDRPVRIPSGSSTEAPRAVPPSAGSTTPGRSARRCRSASSGAFLSEIVKMRFTTGSGMGSAMGSAKGSAMGSSTRAQGRSPLRSRSLTTAMAAATCLAAAGLCPAEAKPGRALTDQERTELVGKFRGYLDVESPDAYRARLQLIRVTNDLREKGANVFADLDALSSILYAARPFNAPFTKKSLPPSASFHQDPSLGATTVGLDAQRMTVGLPSKFDPKKANASPPLPTLITLHELEDYQGAKVKEFPGEEVIRRRWDRKGPMKPVTDEWLLFAPVATRAAFLVDGEVNKDAMPFIEVWTRYPVDFDRVVIEGGADALQFAAAKAVYYAGVIVRDAKAEIAQTLVGNFASVPVYVVGAKDSPAAKALEGGGHKAVTAGGAEGLPGWLAKLPKRTTPKSFKWTILNETSQRLAYWVNVDSYAEGGDPKAEKTLEVEVVDTEKDPNTVRITAKGIAVVSLFLNDRIVDLDRPVRVVANGKEVKRCQVQVEDSMQEAKLPGTFERTLDITFDASWASMRRSMMYGFLYPVQLRGISVPEPEKAGGAPPTTPSEGPPPAPGPLGEQNAQRYFEKAEELEGKEEPEKALGLYRKCVAEGGTTFYARALAKVKELEALVKQPDDPKPPDEPK